VFSRRIQFRNVPPKPLGIQHQRRSRRNTEVQKAIEVWKSTTNSKHEQIQSRKRKRDNLQAAESMEKMRRDATRSDTEYDAASSAGERADMLKWMEKRITELVKLVSGTEQTQ
jgi:hypothetical protein